MSDTLLVAAPEAALSEEEAQRRDALAGRIFNAGIEALELGAIFLGDRLGLYHTLAGAGPATPVELAARSGINERYAREWLEQQAVAGMLDVDDPTLEAPARRYSISPGHAEVLTERDSPNYLAPLARTMVGMFQPAEALLEAYRSGGGVPYAAYGADTRVGQAEMNRPMYINQLGSQWIAALPDVQARLQADPPARVADIACGLGWSSIALAKAFPKARVDGFDSDEESVALARWHAADAGLEDRVTFKAQDAAQPLDSGSYDLVLVFEALHDMARPVEALSAIRAMLAPNGTVLIADERVADSFTAPGDELERFFYGASILFCLPTGMAEQPSAGTGTVMRADTMRRYAMEAGFAEVQIVPIENPFWRFYRLIG